MATTSILNSVLAATSGSSSGIDVASTVSAILYADRAPERTWQAEQSSLASKTSAINQLESESSSLSDQVSALQDPGGALSSIAATSSNSSIVSASALAGTATGSHTIAVQSLASTGSWYSDTVASSSAALPAGTSFTIASGGTSTTINVGNGVDTLDQVAATINNQALGVTASVVRDSSGARLSLVANTSGAAADFSVTSNNGPGFTRSGTGADAVFKVDGVPLTSASNTVSGSINGVTLNLQSAGTVNLTLTPDTNSITQTVSSFVSAYNALIKDVNSQFHYNNSTSTAGALSTDSAVQGLQTALLNATNYNSAASSFATLASLGISTGRDGTLTLDTTALANAIGNNFTAVTTFFQGTASDGFGTSLANALTTYTDPSQGAFTVDLASISSENQDLSDQTNSLEIYLSSQQSSLTTKYNNADIALQQLPQKLKQINALLNPSNSSSNG